MEYSVFSFSVFPADSSWLQLSVNDGIMCRKVKKRENDLKSIEFVAF